tara:strand:+ start:142 stop:468 length:327 start_codon:yes stop_codon:yes gene_type:complete
MSTSLLTVDSDVPNSLYSIKSPIGLLLRKYSSLIFASLSQAKYHDRSDTQSLLRKDRYAWSVLKDILAFINPEELYAAMMQINHIAGVFLRYAKMTSFGIGTLPLVQI